MRVDLKVGKCGADGLTITVFIIMAQNMIKMGPDLSIKEQLTTQV